MIEVTQGVSLAFGEGTPDIDTTQVALLVLGTSPVSPMEVTQGSSLIVGQTTSPIEITQLFTLMFGNQPRALDVSQTALLVLADFLEDPDPDPEPPPIVPGEYAFGFEIKPVSGNAIFVSAGRANTNSSCYLRRVDSFGDDFTSEFILHEDFIELAFVPQRGERIAITTIGWGGVGDEQNVLESRYFTEQSPDWPVGANGPFLLANPSGTTYEIDNIYAVANKQRVAVESLTATDDGRYVVYLDLAEPLAAYGTVRLIVYDTVDFLHIEQSVHTHGGPIVLDPVPVPTLPVEATLLVWRVLTEDDIGSQIGDDTVIDQDVGRMVRLTPPSVRYYAGDGVSASFVVDLPDNPAEIFGLFVTSADQPVGIPLLSEDVTVPFNNRGSISSHDPLPTDVNRGDYYVVSDDYGDFSGDWQNSRRPYWEFTQGDLIVYLGTIWDAASVVNTLFVSDAYIPSAGTYISVLNSAVPSDYTVMGSNLILPEAGTELTTGQTIKNGDTIHVMSFQHNGCLGIQTDRFVGTEASRYVLSQRPYDQHTLWVSRNGRDQIYGIDFTLVDVEHAYDVPPYEITDYEVGFNAVAVQFFEPHDVEDVIVATNLAHRPQRMPVAFRLFQNNMAEWHYLRISDYHKTRLVLPHRRGDNFLAVEEARIFIPAGYQDQPNIVQLREPVGVLIGTERFEFTQIDLTGDHHLLLNIRRGTYGTSAGIAAEYETASVSATGTRTYTFAFSSAPLSTAGVEIQAVDFRGKIVKEYRGSEYTIDTFGTSVTVTLAKRPNTDWTLRMSALLADWSTPSDVIYETGTCVVDVGPQQIIPTGYRWIAESIQYSNASMPVFLREYPGTQYCPPRDTLPTEPPEEPEEPEEPDTEPYWIDLSESTIGPGLYVHTSDGWSNALLYTVDPADTEQWTQASLAKTATYLSDPDGWTTITGDIAINGTPVTVTPTTTMTALAGAIDATDARAAIVHSWTSMAHTGPDYIFASRYGWAIVGDEPVDLDGSDTEPLDGMGLAAPIISTRPPKTIGAGADYQIGMCGNGPSLAFFMKVQIEFTFPYPVENEDLEWSPIDGSPGSEWARARPTYRAMSNQAWSATGTVSIGDGDTAYTVTFTGDNRDSALTKIANASGGSHVLPRMTSLPSLSLINTLGGNVVVAAVEGSTPPSSGVVPGITYGRRVSMGTTLPDAYDVSQSKTDDVYVRLPNIELTVKQYRDGVWTEISAPIYTDETAATADLTDKQVDDVYALASIEPLAFTLRRWTGTAWINANPYMTTYQPVT